MRRFKRIGDAAQGTRVRKRSVQCILLEAVPLHIASLHWAHQRKHSDFVFSVSRHISGGDVVQHRVCQQITPLLYKNREHEALLDLWQQLTQTYLGI